MTLDYTKSFIEEQFPVSKVSKESYKERKANLGQTLTGLGKWWGRKPLVLIRAITIGCLLPVSDDKQKDKEVFLELMNMSESALIKRKIQSLPTEVIYENISEETQNRMFTITNGKPKYKSGIGNDVKLNTQLEAYKNLSYDSKLVYCKRPEHMDSEKDIDWNLVNSHLQTHAHNIQELVNELSMKRYGHRAIVSDCFCGGGSNVFEPARLGCCVTGTDLNPLAGVLTWADLNIIGTKKENYEKYLSFQDKVFDYVTNIIDSLDIESNENDELCKYFLYCNEVKCPECGYTVPLAPSWDICNGNRNKRTVAVLDENENKGFDIHIISDASNDDMEKSKSMITIKKSMLCCPHCGKQTSMQAIRGGEDSRFIKPWGREQFTPKDGDVFHERLYAIKCFKLDSGKFKEDFRKKDGPVTESIFGRAVYREPTQKDFDRETKAHNYVKEHLDEWISKGYLPQNIIEEGYNTSQLLRERGWRYWFQLFNERQLIFLCLLQEAIDVFAKDSQEIVMGILMINKVCDFNSKITPWMPNVEASSHVFYNQSLNTMYNYPVKSTYALYTICKFNMFFSEINTQHKVNLVDAIDFDIKSDIFITDPPYADAINYHELSEFFLGWDNLLLKKAFPTWYSDSKRALAIKGTGKEFNDSMVLVYKNLANYMSDNGLQVVMFTHQDTQVWAELAMILWSAGLQVSAAWCIQTETSSGGIRQGNYVQGTVIMILRKQTSNEAVFKDELYEEIRDEVKIQIDSMRDIDQGDNPDFTDGDYLLAAYVAALKVLTSYKKISGIDVQYELEKARENKQNSPVTKLIETAKKEAYDYLVPNGISSSIWRDLIPEERFYIKGFELELNGDMKLSSYQEMARGFGINNYNDLFACGKANQVRLKTPTEFMDLGFDKDAFGKSLLRHILKAIQVATKNDSVFDGKNYIKAEYEEGNKYWTIRNKVIELLTYLCQAKDKANMDSWKEDAEYTVMLREAIKNDSI